MNKKGAGVIGFIALILVFNIIWFVWLGSYVAQAGQLAVINGNLTGVEAFFYSNLNMVIFIADILGVMGFLYFGGGN